VNCNSNQLPDSHTNGFEWISHSGNLYIQAKDLPELNGAYLIGVEAKAHAFKIFP